MTEIAPISLATYTPPPEAWPEFNAITEPTQICKREWVGVQPRGIRWSLWPLCFERYVGDLEPDLSASNLGALHYNRIIIWDRALRADIPKGWFRISKKPWRIDGVHTLQDTADYTQRWNKNARYDLRRWHASVQEQGYRIAEVPLTAYASAYKKSTVWKKIGNGLLRNLIDKYTASESHPHISLWGAYNPSGELIAGTAALFSPTYHASVYLCPFMLPEAKDVCAMTGLVDHWFKESAQRGFRTQWFTDFWQPGKPKSWKGFSEFKSHFGITRVSYPPELIRFKKGKLW